MARLGTALKKKGRRVRTMVTAGPPALLIVDTAKNMGADLIVMGTHGRTGLAAYIDRQRGGESGPHRELPGPNGAGCGSG